MRRRLGVLIGAVDRVCRIEERGLRVRVAKSVCPFRTVESCLIVDGERVQTQVDSDVFRENRRL